MEVHYHIHKSPPPVSTLTKKNPFLCLSHFWQAQLVSVLVGLRTYQHPGIIGVDCKIHKKHVNTWHNMRYNCKCQWNFGRFEHFSVQIIFTNCNSLVQINFQDHLLIFLPSFPLSFPPPSISPSFLPSFLPSFFPFPLTFCHQELKGMTLYVCVCVCKVKCSLLALNHKAPYKSCKKVSSLIILF